MSLDQIALQVIRKLTDADIPVMVVGSFSSNYWGIPRSTKDVDFVIGLAGTDSGRLWEIFENEYEMDDQLAFETVTGSRKIELRTAGSAFTVEIFLLTEDPHDQSRFRRRRTVQLLGLPVSMPTAEDVIVQKLRWGRSKDVDDARDVMAVQRERLDWSYLRQWCQTHGTIEHLQRLQNSFD